MSAEHEKDRWAYICFECASAKGWAWPEGLRVQVIDWYCQHCGRNRAVVPAECYEIIDEGESCNKY